MFTYGVFIGDNKVKSSGFRGGKMLMHISAWSLNAQCHTIAKTQSIASKMLYWEQRDFLFNAFC